MRAREIIPGMPIRIEDHFGRNATGIAGHCYKEGDNRYSYCNVIFADGHVYPVCVTKITKYVYGPRIREISRTINVDFTNAVRRYIQSHGNRL